MPNYNENALKPLVGLVNELDVLNAVKLATTSTEVDIDVEDAPTDIDGVTLEVGDRILVKNNAYNSVAKASSIVIGDVVSNNAVEYEAVTPGNDGNNITLTYADPGSESQSLSVGVAAGTDITVNLETDADVNATADIGSETNGTVTTTVDAAGSDGNDYTIEVEVGAGNDVALSASLTETDITVTLGTDGAGAADASKNTATLIATEIDGLSGVTAVASGDGNGTILDAEGPTQFTGGTDYSLVSTADEIVTAINADGSASALVTASNYDTSTGSGLAVAVESTNLADGEDVELVGDASAKRNGIYEVSTITPVVELIRTYDADSAGEINKRTYVGVTNGTENAEKGFYINDDVSTLGTDEINFTEYKI